MRRLHGSVGCGHGGDRDTLILEDLEHVLGMFFDEEVYLDTIVVIGEICHAVQCSLYSLQIVRLVFGRGSVHERTCKLDPLLTRQIIIRSKSHSFGPLFHLYGRNG